MDEDTRWSWRWRCPACGHLEQGVGPESAKVTAERRIRDHELDERMLERAARHLTRAS